jgi:hypothetical protein
MKEVDPHIETLYNRWRNDWPLFAREILKVDLDPDQESILRSVQVNKMTSVVSGTSRGKDFVAAVACICFMYLTPVWDENGKMIENTKVAMTAPSDRQVGNIMFPEISRIFNNVKILPGRLTGYDIRTDNEEWFLTGFKADEKKHEAWSGFHAANTMFVITEASGISEDTFTAIEGNLQGNSRILIVFNANVSVGYAARSQKSPRWHKFRLDSLNAPNVLQKKIVIPGQVDYEWVDDKVTAWCEKINPEEFSEAEGDFEWNGLMYRPNDTFRIKVRGMFPKSSEDVLIPLMWVQLAQERFKEHHNKNRKIESPLRLGADVAGMGRDSSAFAHRYGNYVAKFDLIQGAGEANHMEISGKIKNILEQNTNGMRGVIAQGFIDTIGEGAGVYSRLLEQKMQVYSCKFSEGAQDGKKPLKDMTGQYQFLNMRAYTYWAIRDWLDPKHNTGAMLPPDCDELAEELTETKWKFRSDGKIQIEDKEEIKKRLKRSPDRADALANTFWPIPDVDPRKSAQSSKQLASIFH